MTASPAFYDSGDNLIAATLPISAEVGVPGTPPVIVQIINNKDGTGADDLTNARLKLLFGDVGDQLLEDGTEWADGHYVEVRIEAGGWNNTLPESEWLPLGANRTFEIPTLPNDMGVTLGFRLNAPLSALADMQAFSLRLIETTGEPVSQGIHETRPGGVYIGLHDSAFTEQVQGGDVVENPAGADRDVQVPDVVWLSQGGAYSALEQLITIPNAAAGMGRIDLLSLAADGSGVTLTTGVEVDEIDVGVDDRPAIPAGDLALAYVTALDSTSQPDVLDSDIANVWRLSLYDFSSVGLVATISRGPTAVVDNHLVTNQVAGQVTLQPSTTNYVWLTRTGLLSATTTPVPTSARALLLWEADTDPTDVTATRDRRHFTGADVQVLRFDFLGEATSDFAVGDPPAAAAIRYQHLHGSRPAWILPLRPMVLSLGDQVDGSGLSGQTRVRVEVERAGVFEDLFPSDLTQPEIAFDAVAPLVDDGALPESFDVPPDARFRAFVTEVPAGTITTNPIHVQLSVLVAT